MLSTDEMRRQLTEKAFLDSDFRRQLIANPKDVIHQEFGIYIPDHINIQVHDSDMRTVHLDLPPGPTLDEEDLEAISGGLCCCGV